MPFRRRCVITAVIAIIIGLGLSSAMAQSTTQSTSQSWPSKPIRAFIPFAAGSATDIVPRALFEPLGAELGQSIIVENRGGAGGTLGMGAVIRAEADGYTILANSSAHTIAPWIVPNFPFDLSKDLSSALMIGQNANILIVSAAKGWKTVQELVSAAKAKPGSINYGSAGVGTATHIAAEKFRVAAGFEAVHIAYKGGAEALADTVAGRIDFYYCPISTALPFIEDKRVLALAVSTATRAPELPDVPTSLEAGYPNSDLTIWYGVFMPSKTARDIVERFHSAATRVVATPAMQQRLKQLAINPMPMTPAEMDKYIMTELGTNEKVIKAAGIK
jgi:tripartite-type tricarboxylate transporter receptor subunit TctC